MIEAEEGAALGDGDRDDLWLIPDVVQIANHDVAEIRASRLERPPAFRSCLIDQIVGDFIGRLLEDIWWIADFAISAAGCHEAGRGSLVVPGAE